MNELYENDYTEKNKYCIICGEQTKIRNCGGGRFEFECPNSNLRNKNKPVHYFVVMEDYFKDRKDRIQFIIFNFNDWFIYFSYDESRKNIIYLSKDYTFREFLEFPRIKYTNYKEMSDKVNKLLIFI